MSILPEGEDVRKAVRWISEQRLDNPKASLRNLIEQACLKFNLSPKDAAILEKYLHP